MVLLFDKQLKAERDYWADKLSGDVPSTNLILDYPRPAQYVDKRYVETINIPTALSSKVRKLAKDSPFLIYVLLMTSLKTCLYKYTGNPSIIVGSPSRKTGEDTETKPNLVSVIDKIDDQTTMRQLIKQIRATLLEAYRHQSYPFEHVIRDVGIKKQLNSCPVFDIILAYSEIHGEFPDLKNDITLTFENQGEAFGGELVYNASLFAPDTIERFTQHFLNALNTLVEYNQASVAEVDLLTEAERQQVLVEWNQCKADFPLDKSFQELFEAQVAKTPDQIAVCFEEEAWTYRELNAKANRMARGLVKQNVGPDSVVPLLAERGVWFVATVIAIFKAGGAYLPVDPNYPVERMRKVIQKSATRTIVVTSEFAEKMEEVLEGMSTDKPPQFFVAEDLLAREQNEKNLPVVTGEKHLSYVLFTSGSTGEPKGVMIEQLGMINHLFLMIQDFDLINEDIVAQTASQCFDISVWQFLAALLVGGKVHIFNYDVARDPEKLFQQADVQGVHIMQIVPSLLRAFLHGIENEHFLKPKLSKLKCLSVTGEAFPPDLARKWFEHYADIPLMNAYGPSECSDDVTMYPIHESPPENAVNIPIGKVIPNLQVYVLDFHLNPVPIGVTGEIYVGGIGVGRGYLNDPEKTNATFLQNPFVDDPQARLYKTGDLGRYLSDGNLEYIGRVDYQVKIRGYRIELGEIDAVLRQFPRVQDVATMVRDGVGDNKQIVSYVVCEQGIRLQEAELKGFLKQCLPEYMVPHIFVWLDAMPLTPNGKLDYKALPAPNFIGAASSDTYVAPRNHVEQVLADIWAEVLNLEKIGVRSNFFELGGDSILSIQMAYKSKQQGIFIRPTHLLEHQTIEELSSMVSEAKTLQAEQGAVSGGAPLTSVQEWFFEQEYLDAHHWNQATFLQLRERVRIDVLQEALKRILEHHDALRVRFEQTATGVQQLFQDSYDSLPFERVNLAGMAKKEQVVTITKLAEKYQASLDIWNGPLLRVVLFDLGEDEPERLLFIIHHLVVDGVSWRILLDDFQTVYQSLRRKEAPPLSVKTTSYKMWAERLVDYAQSQNIAEDIPFWLNLAQRDVSALPIDKKEGDNTVGSSQIISEGLTAEETKSLLQQVPAFYNVQINDVLLTALLKIFSQWTGESSLFLNLEGHGREDLFDDLDVSRTVGWFTSEFPVMLELDCSLTSVMSQIQEQLKKIPQRGFSYGLLRYLHSQNHVREQFAALAKPEVSFNYLGQFNEVSSVESMFEAAPESMGSLRSARDQRNYLVDINGAVIDGCLRFNWEYSDNLHHRATIEQLAQGFMEALRSIIHDCSSAKIGEKQVASTQEQTGVRSYTWEFHEPMTHMQQWFFEQEFVEAHHWNTAIVLKTVRSVEPNLLQAAVQHIVLYHDVLRLRYRQTEEGWIQFQEQRKDHKIFEYMDFSDVAEERQKSALEQAVSNYQSELNLTEGPLIKVVLFDLGVRGQRVFIVVHHLVIDHMSWVFLMEDIQTAYMDLEKGLVPRLPAKTTAYQDWAKKLTAYAQSPELFEEMKYWVEEQKTANRDLPRDCEDGNNIEVSLAEFYFALSVEDTESLFAEVRAAYQMHVGDVLLTAMAMTLVKWKGEGSVLIDQGIHGREDISKDVDLSRTVGWFTTSFPTKFEIDSDESIEKILLSTKERLETSRQYGFNYAVMKSLCKDQAVKEALSQIPTPQVSFDYDGPLIGSAGRKGEAKPSLWEHATESRGSVRSPKAQRYYELDVRSWVYNSQIMLNWQYSTNVHEKSTIESLSEMYVSCIKRIIASAQSAQ
ncbi:amino acid adenylation domain-containing protein [Bacillus fungorum]|uniref:amino acid adenylation domain-containing protein n=1 Tax=Bacillus fungorum TaxID=2039284 RepID=UPI003F543C2E